MKSTLILLGSRLIVPVMSTVLVFVMARQLGREGMGAYATVMAVVNVAMSASALGLRNIVIREVGRTPSDAGAIATNATAVAAMFSLAAYSIVAVLSFAGGYVSEVRSALLIGGCGLLPYAVGFVLESVLIGMELNGAIFMASLTQHAFRVVGSAGVLLAGLGLRAVMAVFVASNVVLAGWYLARAMAATRMAGGLSWRLVKERLLRPLGIFAVLDVIANIYAKLGVLVLSAVAAPAAVGVYAAATSIGQVVQMIPANFALGLFPRLAATGVDSEARAKLVANYLRRAMAVTLPIVVLTWAFAPEAVRLLFGARFTMAADVLRITLVGVLPYGASIALSYLLLATNRQKVEAVFVVGNTSLGAITYWLLSRRLGLSGAAVAASIAPIPLLLAQTALLRHDLTQRLSVRGMLRAVAVMGLWAALTAFCAVSRVPWVAGAALASLTYPVAMMVARILDEQDRARVASLAGRVGWRIR